TPPLPTSSRAQLSADLNNNPQVAEPSDRRRLCAGAGHWVSLCVPPLLGPPNTTVGRRPAQGWPRPNRYQPIRDDVRFNQTQAVPAGDVPVRRVSAVAVLAIAIRPVSRRHPEVPIWRGGERLGTVVR